MSPGTRGNEIRIRSDRSVISWRFRHVPQRLKPHCAASGSAWLKPCPPVQPHTSEFSAHYKAVPSRLVRTPAPSIPAYCILPCCLKRWELLPSPVLSVDYLILLKRS